MRKINALAWMNPLLGGVWLVGYLGTTLAGQFYICTHIASPWRGILFLATLPIEYVCLVRWSSWMDRRPYTATPALTQPPSPTLIVLPPIKGSRVEVADELGQLAQEYQAIVLIETAENRESDRAAWVEGIRAQLARRGVPVTVQMMARQTDSRHAGEGARAKLETDSWAR